MEWEKKGVEGRGGEWCKEQCLDVFKVGWGGAWSGMVFH